MILCYVNFIILLITFHEILNSFNKLKKKKIQDIQSYSDVYILTTKISKRHKIDLFVPIKPTCGKSLVFFFNHFCVCFWSAIAGTEFLSRTTSCLPRGDRWFATLSLIFLETTSTTYVNNHKPFHIKFSGKLCSFFFFFFWI